LNKLEKLEKRNRWVSLFTSIGVHALLLLVFMLTVAVGAPGPPAAQFGVVVNIGFDDQGSGDIQTDKPVAQEDPEQEPVEQEPQPSEPEPVAEQKPDKKDDEELVSTKIESPVTVKAKEEPKKEEPKKEEPKKEVPKEPEKLKTEYTKENAQTAQKSNSKGENSTSEGDDVNKTGNKGQPDGTLDPNGQYKGTPGGGGGGNGGFLAMSGWGWAEQPSTSGVSNNESGRIVFEIECDEDGEIIKITTIERGVSAATEQLLRAAIQKTSLVRDDAFGKAPPHSSGKVTFVIKSR
jgi:outer membrane biosynthesis protein TonB